MKSCAAAVWFFHVLQLYCIMVCCSSIALWCATVAFYYGVQQQHFVMVCSSSILLSCAGATRLLQLCHSSFLVHTNTCAGLLHPPKPSSSSSSSSVPSIAAAGSNPAAAHPDIHRHGATRLTTCVSRRGILECVFLTIVDSSCRKLKVLFL